MRNEDRDDDDDQADGRDDDRKSGSMSSSGAHLRLSVEPEDASIYLDGQFVGTGSDLSLLQAGLPVAPGTHRLAVVRPGHRAVEKEFDVKAGGEIELEIELESGSGRVEPPSTACTFQGRPFGGALFVDSAWPLRRNETMDRPRGTR